MEARVEYSEIVNLYIKEPNTMNHNLYCSVPDIVFINENSGIYGLMVDKLVGEVSNMFITVHRN